MNSVADGRPGRAGARSRPHQFRHKGEGRIRSSIATPDVRRSATAVLGATLLMRLSSGVTAGLVIYYLADLPRFGGAPVDPLVVGVLTAAFFLSELVLSAPFGMLGDRWGHRSVMLLGPWFGAIAALWTATTTNVALIGVARLLHGSSSAASIPSTLAYLARDTAGDEGWRGRIVARFQFVSIAGLGMGLVAAGPMWDHMERWAFALNAVMYAGSWLVYLRCRREPPRLADAGGTGILTEPWRRRASFRPLFDSRVLLLAPTWIAVNAALGLWTSQTIFQLVRVPDPRFAMQHLMGRLTPTEVSLGLTMCGLAFFGGLLFWGNRFKTIRRTTMILLGGCGGLATVAGLLVVNHSESGPLLLEPIGAGLALGGLFVLAAATPAALGMLSDISELYPRDRGAVMGLYTVFLGVGQIAGSLIGGEAGHEFGIDGVLVATAVLVGIGLVPLWRLRGLEATIGGLPAASPGGKARAH